MKPTRARPYRRTFSSLVLVQRRVERTRDTRTRKLTTRSRRGGHLAGEREKDKRCQDWTEARMDRKGTRGNQHPYAEQAFNSMLTEAHVDHFDSIELWMMMFAIFLVAAWWVPQFRTGSVSPLLHCRASRLNPSPARSFVIRREGCGEERMWRKGEVGGGRAGNAPHRSFLAHLSPAAASDLAGF